MNEELDQNTSLQESHWRYLNGSSSYTYQSNITYLPFYQHTHSIVAVFIVSYLIIFLLCMLGNGLVCFIVLRNRHMRTVTNLFILNLAVSDLLVGLFCMPTTLVDNILTGWPFGSFVCKMSGLVQGVSVSASVFTLVAIAVDRFRCIVYPFKQKLNIFTATVIIIVIWVLAISIMCPSAIMLQVTKWHGNVEVVSATSNKTYAVYQCFEAWPNQRMKNIYTTVLFANIYLAPLSLIVIMYARIGITLFKSISPAGEKPGQVNRNSIPKKKQKIIKMLTIVALLFTLSWLPLWTLMMFSDYARLTTTQFRVINFYIYPFAHWLAFFNSSVNPIIYGYFNENFRRGFQTAFRFQLFSSENKRRETYSRSIPNKIILPTLNKIGQDPITINSDYVVEPRISKPVKNECKYNDDLVLEDLDKGTNNSLQKDLL